MRYFFLCLIWIAFLTEILFSQSLPAVADILAKADKNWSGKSLSVNIRQVVTRKNGEKRVMTLLHSSVDRGKKQVFEFYSPESIRGVKIYVIDSGMDIRVYSPFRKELSKITTVQKKNSIMGTDFRFEDILAGGLAVRFSGRTLHSEKVEKTDCFVLSLRPAYEGSGYTRVLMWVAKSDYMVRRVDYYQENESTPFKRLLLEDIRDFKGRKFPMKWFMLNLNNGGKTYSEIVTVRFDKILEDSFFDFKNLEKDNPGGN